MPEYYIIDASAEDRMLLNSVPDPSDHDRWLAGRVFKKSPKEPVEVRIKKGNEDCQPLPFFAHPAVMSSEFYEALRAAGVDNLDVYDAVLKSKDGSVALTGYKVFNVVGLVKAADLEQTKFDPDNPSRLIDASIDELAVDSSQTHGLLMFRMAESVTTIFVHESVKRSLEEHDFYGLVFRDPGKTVII